MELTFAKKHNIDLTLLQSAEKYEVWEESMVASDFTPSDVLEWHNMKTAGNKEISANDTKHTGAALMARLFYSYDNRYMLTHLFVATVSPLSVLPIPGLHSPP